MKNFRIFYITLLFLILSSLFSTSFEQTSKWKSLNGPPGGHVYDFIQNPNNPNNIFISTGRGVYFSSNKGEDWNLVRNSGGIKEIVYYEEQIYGCREDGIYLIGKDKIYANVFNQTLDCNEMVNYDRGIIVSAKTDTISQAGKINKLDLHNLNYKDISPSKNELSPVVFPPAEFKFESDIKIPNLYLDENLYLANILIDAGGTSETFFGDTEFDSGGSGKYTKSYLYRSVDYGDTWKLVNLPDYDNKVITKIVSDPNANKTYLSLRHKRHLNIFFPVSELILSSEDKGKTWNYPYQCNLSANGITDIDIKKKHIFLSLIDGGIVKLNDSGCSLIPLNAVNNFPNVTFQLNNLEFDIDNTSSVFGLAMYRLGLIKSEDMLRTWKKIDSDIISTSPTIIENHPENSDLIITASNMGQIPYITKDRGHNWQPIKNVKVPMLFADEVKINSNNPQKAIFVTEVSHFYDLDINDNSYSRLSPTFKSYDIVKIEHAQNESPMYISTKGVGLFRGVDSWWEYIEGSPDYSYDFLVDPFNPNTLYIGTSPKSFENHSSIFRYSKNSSGEYRWREIFRKQPSLGVTDLEISEGTIYAGISGKDPQIVYTVDDGETWDILNDNLTFSNVKDVKIDPNNPNTIYAALWGGGLFKSNNAGKDWKKIDTPTFSIVSIIIDPKNSDHLFISDRTKPKIYESTDGGITWTELVSLDTEKFYRISSMILHEDNIYFSVFRKVKGKVGTLHGETYLIDEKPINLSKNLGKPIIKFYSKNGTLYAISHISGLYKLENGVWKNISQTLPDLGLIDIMIDDSKNLYVASGGDRGIGNKRRIGDDNLVNEIFLKHADSKEWLPLLGDNPFSSTVRKIIRSPLNNNVFYAATGTGVYKSEDRGITWEQQNRGLGMKDVNTMDITSNLICVGTSGGGVYCGEIINESSDINWSVSSGPTPTVYNILIEVSETNSDTIYASSYPGGIFKSTDKGITWEAKNFALPSFEVNFPLQQGYYSIEMNPQNPEMLFLGIYGKGVYKSTDGADTWSPLYGRNGQNRDIMKKKIKKVEIDPENTSHVYLATESGVYRSMDEGEHWESVNTGLKTNKTNDLEFIDGSLFVGTQGYGMYKLDKSKEWRQELYLLPIGYWSAWERRKYDFISLEFKNDEIFMGHFPGGFFKSENSGRTWTDSSFGITNDGIFSLTIDPKNREIFYGGTYNGIVKSTNSGKTWERKNYGIPSEQWPFSILVDKEDTDTLYVTTKNGQNKGFCYRNDFCGLVLKSNDAGDSWKEIMSGLNKRHEYYNILACPTNTSTLFLSSNNGVYISFDAGEKWAPINKGLPTKTNQVRYNVADILTFSSNYKSLIYGLVDHGLWELNIEDVCKVENTDTSQKHTFISVIRTIFEYFGIN